MSFIRSFLHHPWCVKILAFFCYYYIRCVSSCSQWKEEGYNHVLEANAHKEAAIFVFWHGRMALMPMVAPKSRPMHVIISLHRDGGWISYVMEYFRFKTIRGSSRKGGNYALRQAISALKKGENVAMTPDGPRGPRMHINGNVIALAQHTGRPIIPMTYSMSLRHVIKSWDAFLFPFPFGKAIRVYGEALYVPKEATKSARHHYKLILEERLNTITRVSDTYVKKIPIEPHYNAFKEL